MRSLTVRILLAVLGTLFLSLVAFLATFRAMSAPANVRLIRHFQARQIEEGLEALRARGPDSAARRPVAIEDGASAPVKAAGARAPRKKR